MDHSAVATTAGGQAISTVDCGKFSPDRGSPECSKNDNAAVGILVVLAVVAMVAFCAWLWWARRRLGRSSKGRPDSSDGD